jgi:DNA segregation ATPase FtsK/SpoIIIE-like protein|tara:strand:- start:51 stop:233 length:183 start_codon:yes stop_codon:yes gene_type:complete
MGLEQIIQDYKNEIEPRLDEMIKYFESNADTISISNLQRQFGLGYRRASRAKNQLKERTE